MKRVLTDALIRAVKPPISGRTELADLRCGGLCFRVTSAGARSWCFRYRDKTTGKDGRFTIGRYPDMALAAARKATETLRADVAAGVNPIERKRQTRVDAPSKTFAALAERYMAEHARRKKRSHARDQQNLELHVLPRWGRRAYAGITRADVIELIEGLVLAGKPVMANRIQSLVSGVFSFAIDASLRDDNPCARLKKRGTETVKDRVLADAEIRLFWNGIVEAPVSRRVGLGLRLALLTGCRVGEVAGIARDELSYLHDDARAEWLIPADRVKNKRAHLVPLSPMARAVVLELLQEIGPAQQALIPSKDGSGAVRAHTLTNAVGRFGEGVAQDNPTLTGAASWIADRPTAHDLRRTVETRLSSLGISKEDRDAALNHVNSSVGRKHYDRYDRAAEKRRALNAWGASLARVLADLPAGMGEVVPFRGSVAT